MLYFEERKTLVKMCQRIYNKQLVIGTWGNFSIRVADDKFLITPSGMDYETLTFQDMVLMNLEEEVIEGCRKPSIENSLHALIYKNRRDIKAIIHTHADYTKAFAIARKPIPPVAEDLVEIVGGEVEVAEYNLPGSKELANAAVKGLKNKMAVLLANHGLVAVGKDLEEALKVAIVVEKNAKSIIFSYLLGKPVKLSEEDIKYMRDFYLTKYGQK